MFYPVYERLLLAEIDETPDHVAVIQDGNRRYARERGEDASKGHVYGAETTEALLDWACDLGVEKITLYTFSTENFERPDDELDSLFDLMERKLDDLTHDDRVHENGIRISGIGDVDRLPDRVVESLREAEEATQGYDSYRLNLAVGYGGRDELLRASERVLRRVEEGEIEPEEIDSETVSEHIYTREEDVDLVVRTGGDERISNFLPWQAKGNESAVYFCAPYWPAFRKIDFMRAIRTFSNRERERHDRDVERAVALVREIGAEGVGLIPEVSESREGSEVTDGVPEANGLHEVFDRDEVERIREEAELAD
ncbi:MAG: polyprenyl diphosphate synthase [Halobacteria archaeon]|nr:polyprenyl diphosphate synthase [Halobacteria archaeon]